MGAKVLCRKCVLPECYPELTLGPDGICSECHNVEKRQGHRLFESDLIKILDKYRRHDGYDCIVMCSGGKDSTAALYMMKKRYKMRPLAFTFNNGFEDPIAVENVKKAADILQVDWINFRSEYMLDMFREMIKSSFRFPACALCSLWYMQIVYRTVSQFKLDLVIGGWTEGQVSVRESAGIFSARRKKGFSGKGMNGLMAFLSKDVASFVEQMREKYDKYKKFPRDMSELNKMFKASRRAKLISPHWFLPIGAEEYTRIIKDELGWKEIPFSYPAGSTNCTLNYLGSLLCMEHFGFTHFHIEDGKLIRNGELTRAESLERLNAEGFSKNACDAIDSVLKKLKLSRKDLPGEIGSCFQK
jgi:3'-phosphoadenosine 5'-phosphosulfate sulfotransferase (PAPS reductase)/FAD synthetase